MSGSQITTLSNYAKRMARLSAQIFGEVRRPTDSKSMKVVWLMSERPRHLDRDLTEYYPRHRELESIVRKLRFHGLYRSEHLDFVDEMKRLRILRGKGKPKKGEGKRAAKRTS